jgi:hypothetical protein
MKKTSKFLIACFAMLTLAAQAQPVVVTESKTEIFDTNLGPGYSQSIDLATVEQLDNAVQTGPEFEQPNNFMSDEGVYRYAYYEKTGTWLNLKEARDALRMETRVEKI